MSWMLQFTAKTAAGDDVDAVNKRINTFSAAAARAGSIPTTHELQRASASIRVHWQASGCSSSDDIMNLVLFLCCLSPILILSFQSRAVRAVQCLQCAPPEPQSALLLDSPLIKVPIL